MTVLVLTVFAIELLAYFVLLSRLATITRLRKPDVFAALGAPAARDYLIVGFGPADTFISKLESHRDQVTNEPQILRLMRAVRGIYIALIFTFCVGFIAMIAYAN
jgi:hypothetical protein